MRKLLIGAIAALAFAGTAVNAQASSWWYGGGYSPWYGSGCCNYSYPSYGYPSYGYSYPSYGYGYPSYGSYHWPSQGCCYRRCYYVNSCGW